MKESMQLICQRQIMKKNRGCSRKMTFGVESTETHQIRPTMVEQQNIHVKETCRNYSQRTADTQRHQHSPPGGSFDVVGNARKLCDLDMICTDDMFPLCQTRLFLWPSNRILHGRGDKRWKES